MPGLTPSLSRREGGCRMRCAHFAAWAQGPTPRPCPACRPCHPCQRRGASASRPPPSRGSRSPAGSSTATCPARQSLPARERPCRFPSDRRIGLRTVRRSPWLSCIPGALGLAAAGGDLITLEGTRLTSLCDFPKPLRGGFRPMGSRTSTCVAAAATGVRFRDEPIPQLGTAREAAATEAAYQALQLHDLQPLSVVAHGLALGH